MTRTTDNIDAELREQAEARANRESLSVKHLSMEEAARLIHELQVHRIELEMQNEELRRTQQSLENSRDRFFHLFQLAPVGYLVLDEEARVLKVNQAFCEMTGWGPEEVRNRLFFDFLAEQDRPALLSRYTALFENPAGKILEADLPLSGGNAISVRMEASKLEDSIAEGASGGVSLLLLTLSDMTRQKQVECALRFGEERYRTTLMGIGDGVITTDASGRVELLNPIAEKLTGWSSEEARERPLEEVFQIVHETTRQTVENPVREVMRQGRIVGLANHTLLIAREGTERPIADSGAPIYNERNEITGVVLVFRDRTAERKARRALQDSWQFLRNVLDTIPVRIFWKDRDLRFLGCNLPFARDAGLETPEQIVGKDDFQMGWLDQAQRYRKDDLEVLESGIPKFAYVEPQTTPKGDTIILRSNKIPLKNAKGAVIGVLGTYEDITERNRVEELLSESEARFRLLFQESPLSTMLFAMDSGELVDANAAAVASYGCATLEELKALDFWGEAPYSRAEILEWNRKAGLHGPQHFEWLSRKKSGEPFWEDVYLRKLDMCGISRIMAISADITERKQFEEERDNLQTQLLQARKMESVGTLAGGVAHDFNNLLQAIGGYVQIMLLGKTDSDDPDLPRLQAIDKTVERAAQLVRKLLLFSRTAKPRLFTVDLNQEVQQAVRILERTIPRMIRIDMGLANCLWPVQADAAQMELMLLNLGGNAADAMPDGGALSIETENVALDAQSVRNFPNLQPGKYVRLSISDTGFGMSKETMAQIFDPFFTTKEANKGTGLGLASVWGIVKSHLGSIICTSAPGSGTTFTIHLPAQEGTCMPSTRLTPAARMPQGGTETILVVDDEADIRDLTGEALQAFHYRVLKAASGEEALEQFKAENNPVDLVVLDLNMPGMGGMNCMRKLLRLHPEVKILIVSGHAAQDQARKCLNSGASGFLGKPYQLTDLLAKMRDILDGCGGSR